MFALKKLLAALILPPSGPVLLALVGLWLGRWRPRLGRGLCAASLLCLLVLSLPWVGGQLQRSLEIYPPIKLSGLAGVQAIVVLGGGSYSNAPEYDGDTIADTSLERVRYAAHLYRRHRLPILVTGGAPVGGRPEAYSMQETLIKEFATPVPWAETASRDTAENAVFSAQMLKEAGVTRIALVSHGWHLRRAVPLFEQQGLEVVPAPTVFSTSTPHLYYDFLPGGGLRASRQALHEWLGILFNRLSGH